MTNWDLFRQNFKRNTSCLTFFANELPESLQYFDGIFFYPKTGYFWEVIHMMSCL